MKNCGPHGNTSEIRGRNARDGRSGRTIAEAYEKGERFSGDSLAKFIVAGLEGICDAYPTTAEQLETAEQRMCTAIDQVAAFRQMRFRT